MKNRLSFLALFVILIIFVCYRFLYFENNSKNGYNATTWDAFGYYMFLPAEFIYDDVKELKWVAEIDSNYHVTGGLFYQACYLKDKGTYTNKYFSGVALMQSPFFFIGHGLAYLTDEKKDGFSWPYQYSIMFGAIFWCFIGFVFLRKVLLNFFDDKIVAITLLLIALTTNLIQYVSVDGAMSHSYIFPLYSIVLWLTMKWHENPKIFIAFLIGLFSGIATISRPTEFIIVFIPLLWNLSGNKTMELKWKLVLKNKTHVSICIFGGIIGLMPQIMYWQYTTGSFVYNVGSKWFFFNPWWRVLFGPEKGWFLYTPIAIFMILGFFLLKDKLFKRAVLTFCLLNIWIIISWSDWTYGASYSTRALTQSYPVFALPLACLVQWVFLRKKELLGLTIMILLIILNFYQLNIYNKGNLESFSPFLR